MTTVDARPSRPQRMHPAATRCGRLQQLLWALLWLVTAPVALASLAGFGGRLWWQLELLGHFRVQYLAALAASAVVFFFGRKNRQAALVAALAIANAWLIVPLYVPTNVKASPSQGAAKNTLRIVSLNVHAENDRYADVRRFVRDTNPDVVLLLEISPQWADALRPLESRYPYVLGHPRIGNFGIALYSRVPLAAARVVGLGRYGVPAVVAQFDVDGVPVHFVGAHPYSPRDEVLFQHRNEQLGKLAELAASLDGPIIVAGDMNMTSWSPFFADLIRKTGLRDSRRSFGVQPTWPAALPVARIPIDHVLVSPEIRVHDRWIGPDLGSDHLPVVLDLSIDRGSK